MYENDCVANVEIDDFLTNVTPKDLHEKMKPLNGGLEVPMHLRTNVSGMEIPHHLEDNAKMKDYRVATEGSVVSDESNLT